MSELATNSVCHSGVIPPVSGGLHCGRERAAISELRRRWPSPVVDLSAAVATAMADGPADDLARLDLLADTEQLRSHHLYHAARASQVASSEIGSSGVRTGIPHGVSLAVAGPYCGRRPLS
jgi:hypothetical protein